MNSLPREPGLERRLAYAEMIRQTTRRNNRMNVRNLTIGTYNVVFEELKEEEKGLRVEEMFANSRVILYKNDLFCSICYDEKEHVYRELCCRHSFHINCIDQWLSKNHTCPICRYDLRQ